MIIEEEIREWWERKIDNYIKNYSRWNKLSLTQAQANIFTESHEKILESIPLALQKLLQSCSWAKRKIDNWCTHSKMVEEPICRSGLNK